MFFFLNCFLLPSIFRKVLFLRLVAVEETHRNVFTVTISVYHQDFLS